MAPRKTNRAARSGANNNTRAALMRIKTLATQALRGGTTRAATRRTATRRSAQQPFDD